MALVLVLVFTGLLMALGGALLSHAVSEKFIAKYQGQDTGKHYIAESGIEVGIAALKSDFSYDREITGSLGEGHFVVVFEDTGEEKKLITSTGYIGDYMTILQVLIEYDHAGGSFTVEWLRPQTID